jgi:hypothetical protein
MYILRCEEAAKDLAKEFGDRTHILVLDISSKARSSDVISLTSDNETISESGRHYGVLLHHKIFDNLHPEGIEYDNWLNQFKYVFRREDVFFRKEDVLWLNDQDFLELMEICEDFPIESNKDDIPTFYDLYGYDKPSVF